MSIDEIHNEMRELKREIRETPPDGQHDLLLRLSNLSRRLYELQFPIKNITYTHDDDESNKAEGEDTGA